MRYLLISLFCFLLSNCQSFVSGNIKPVIPLSKATVLIWWSTSCPCVLRFQSRMHDLQKDYASRSVAVFAVASNADDSFEDIQKVVKERGFKLPMLYDSQGVLAKEIGVYTTPTAVLLDQTGEVKFVGWIDNERLPGVPGRIPYLQNALDQLLDGKVIKTPRAPVYGCRITR